MSKTDKTEPWWIRAKDAGLVEEHDHRFGECDLPEVPEAWSGNWADRPNCTWAPRWWAITSGCGGSCCTGREWKRVKEERRWVKDLELEENPRRAPAKKNTKRWCRGKEGREHQPMISQGSWGWGKCQFRPAWGKKAGTMRWSCFCHEICKVCGKELRYRINMEECLVYKSTSPLELRRQIAEQ